MSIYGYCRISTPQQNIERQERNIKAAYPDAVLVSEAYTGTKIERPKWSRLLARVVKGDTIVFDSVSRMSRDAVDGYAAYEDLYSRGVTLVFLRAAHQHRHLSRGYERIAPQDRYQGRYTAGCS